MKPIKCKNCPEVIELTGNGFWVTHEGWSYCKKRIGDEAPMLHEPIIPDEWRTEIKRLAKHNSSYWTPMTIARLMNLKEDSVKEILNDKESTD